MKIFEIVVFRTHFLLDGKKRNYLWYKYIFPLTKLKPPFFNNTTDHDDIFDYLYIFKIILT